MALSAFLERLQRSLETEKQAAEVTRLLREVYALPNVRRRDVIEFVKTNQIVLLGWATPFELTVQYLICSLDIADRSDPDGRRRVEAWIAATDRAAGQGAKISGRLLRGLAEAARNAYGVGAEDAVEDPAGG